MLSFHAVTGGRLTVKVDEGKIVITSHRLDENELKQLFSDFIPQAKNHKR